MDQVPDIRQRCRSDGALSNALPLVTLSQGYSPQGIAAAVPRHADDLDDTITDAWSWLRGKHYISAGFTQVFNTKRQIPTTASNGQWTFTGTTTGNALADFLLGNAATFTQISNTPEANIHAAGISPTSKTNTRSDLIFPSPPGSASVLCRCLIRGRIRGEFRPYEIPALRGSYRQQQWNDHPDAELQPQQWPGD